MTVICFTERLVRIERRGTTRNLDTCIAHYFSETVGFGLFAAARSVAACLAVLVALAAWLFPVVRKRLQSAKIVSEFRAKSIALSREINAADGVLDLWELKIPPEDAPDAHGLMLRVFSLYDEVYTHHRAGYYPEPHWSAAVEEMKKFVGMQYIKSNIAFAEQLNAPFGEFLRELEQES
ncbi:MAG: hypothetical protein AAFQ79_16010 [Pseudomonadota bacterium]